MRYSICNETFQDWEWEPTCKRIAEIGYHGVEVAPFTLAADVREIAGPDRARIRSAAESAGLEIVGLHWLLVSPKGLSVTSPDPDLRQRTAEYLLALTQFCADLGGHIMVFGSPAQRWRQNGDSEAVTVERYAECLKPSLELAHRHGITICVEPLPPPEASFILTLAEAAAVIQRLDHPAARTILDVKSASSEGAPIPDLIHRHAPLIAHVHANDANRRGPGFGQTDFRPILGALAEIGYDGYVSVEVFDYSPDPETIATNSLAYLRSCEP